MQKRSIIISLAMAAAAGFRGIAMNLGGALDRYATKPARSTAQFSDASYPKRVRVGVAQGKRAAVKAKNRAKHRAACRG